MAEHSKAIVPLLIGDAYTGFRKTHCEATYRILYTAAIEQIGV